MRGTKSTGMLQLEVYVFPNGDLEIRGVLGEDGLYSDGNVNG
jgi:TfoX/Sxy family transcriptional regulator of competence genes